MGGIADLIEHGLQHVLAVDERAPQPAQVVEAERLEADARRGRCPGSAQRRAVLVGMLQKPMTRNDGVPQERLGHDPGRVAQVQDPRVGRARSTTRAIPRTAGTVRSAHDEAAGARRLVADHAERDRKGLVALAGREAARP